MSVRTGYNSTLMKNRNRGIVLQLIATEHLSRAEITKKMGLSKMAISRIVGKLIEDGYIADGREDDNSAVGRNPTLLEISPAAPVSLGIYISRNEVNVLLCDLQMRILFSASEKMQNENAESLTEKLFSLCDGAISYASRSLPGNKILGIGVSAIGPLDPAKGTILRPTDFFCICDFPISKLLSERYALPTFLENDMNASALYEKIFGSGKKYDHFVYLGITNGIGAGVIMNGRPSLQNSISYGEIGHMSIDYGGPLCSCGNRGCLEVYASMKVILKKMSDICGHTVQPDDLSLMKRDSEAGRSLSVTARRLSVALINLVNMLDPQCIIIGHDGVSFPDYIMDELREAVNAGILSKGYQTVPIIRSAAHRLSPMLGSVCLVWNELFYGNLPVSDENADG